MQVANIFRKSASHVNFHSILRKKLGLTSRTENDDMITIKNDGMLDKDFTLRKNVRFYTHVVMYVQSSGEFEHFGPILNSIR